MVESGDDKVDTSEKLKDQILRMDKFNKCDRKLGAHGVIGNVPDNGGSQMSKNWQNVICARSHIGARKLISADKVPQSTTSQADKQHGNCFNCHKPGHRMRDCPIMKLIFDPHSSMLFVHFLDMKPVRVLWLAPPTLER
ncbi:unnamed protein product [Peronospora effusa]|nr:unnamed protein product [Peronospora effusa]